MSRRASLPGADELFRPTGREATAKAGQVTPLPSATPPPSTPSAEPRGPAQVTGRVRHDTKITVYLSSQELLDLEQARLRLRAEFGIGVDRGRLVREAIGMLLSDLHERGPDSTIVRRLS